VLDACEWPAAIIFEKIVNTTRGLNRGQFAEFMEDRKNRRVIPRRFEDAGYLPVRNPDDRRDGQWLLAGRRQTIYARRELSPWNRLAVARALI